MAFYQYKLEVKNTSGKVMATKYYETRDMAEKWFPVYNNQYYPEWEVRLYKLKTEPKWEEIK